MSIFSTILSKLGLGKKTAATTSTGATIAKRTFLGARPTAISQVDVVSKLNALAKTSKQPLDWKVSIVDLLKLLGIDSSSDQPQGTGHRIGLPGKPDEGFCGNEYLVA